MLEPGRQYSAGTQYRYGFNGKEQDNDIDGSGVDYDYGFRIYDARIDRFLSTDPLTGKYPWYTPYQFAGNTPIQAVDIDGREEFHYTLTLNKDGTTTLHQDNIKTVNQHTVFGFKFWPDTKIEGQRAVVNYEGKNYYIGFAGSYGRGNENSMPLFNAFKNAPDATMFSSLFFDEASSYWTEATNASTTIMLNKYSYGPIFEANEAEVIVGKSVEERQVLQVGAYAEMKALNAKSGLSADHIPSFGALKAEAESALGRKLDASEAAALRNESLTLVYETEIHQKFSRTYGGRNRKLMAGDAQNIVGAIKKDINALKPALLKAGYSESEINTATQKLLAPYQPQPKK